MGKFILSEYNKHDKGDYLQAINKLIEKANEYQLHYALDFWTTRRHSIPSNNIEMFDALRKINIEEGYT